MFQVKSLTLYQTFVQQRTVFIYLLVYWLYVYEYPHACMCLNVHVCAGQLSLCVLPQVFSTLYRKTGSFISLAWNLLIRLGWLSSEL